MSTKGPLHTPATLGSVVGGATWGLRNGFDVAPRRARAPRAWPRAWPFPVTARFGHPLLENRVPGHLFWMLSFGKSGAPIQTSSVTSSFYTFFGQVKKLAHSMEISMGLRTIAAGMHISRVSCAIMATRGRRDRTRLVFFSIKKHR